MADLQESAKRAVEEGWEVAGPKKKRKTNQSLALNLTHNLTHQPTLADVQNLLLRIFTEQYGENPRWLCVRGMNLVKCCRVVLLPCLESKVVLNRPASAPFLSALLRGDHRVSMKSSGEVEHFPRDQGASDAGSRLLFALLAARAKPSVGKKKQPSQKEATDKSNTSGAGQQKMPISSYLASEEARRRSGYPDGSYRQATGWIVLPAQEKRDDLEQTTLQDPDARHLVAIDCEMVMTASGLSLARVSLVREDTVLYDTHVRPAEPVTDYLTKFSGITEETLAGVEVSREDVQKRLQELLSDQTILVGHSLESDLKALQLVHERVIDTVLLYPHPRGWPFRQSLAGLTSSVLKRKLHRDDGHDSVEDAKASLELARLKFERGPSFGVSGGDSAPLGRLLKQSAVQLVISDSGMSTDIPEVARAGGHSWYEESCVHLPFNTCMADGPWKEATSQRFVHLVVLRSFERFCQTTHALSGGSLEDGLPNCLAEIDRQAADAAASMTEDDVFIILNGCGNFQLLRKLLDANLEAASAAAEDKKKVARARDRFKDTWGVFCCGGQTLQELARVPLESAPGTQVQRELVSYDF
mmetsp:Transcript_66788/g.157291  ORF Transcript_66788/g.157291 Transcript_66788/m.157291 type:complete len:585 (-) Transcript_66788:116-1870(-)